jgi:hypothetical protein
MIKPLKCTASDVIRMAENAGCDTNKGRPSSLLNRSTVRAKLIQEARDGRYYWQQFDPRVSEATLDLIERATLSAIRNHVSKLPSKGKTI